VNQRGAVELITPEMPELIQQVEKLSKELETLKEKYGGNEESEE
jgi:hypothetical protein